MSPPGTVTSAEALFAPVRSQTAFEETVERLSTAIKLGLLEPGARLPAERELCTRLGIARSTLRQALTALGQSGHVFATRGRGGGTFVADPLPPADPPSPELLASWRELCDMRLGVELAAVALAVERAQAGELDDLDEQVEALARLMEDFPAFRQGDIRLHVGLAELSRSTRLVQAMAEAQGWMTDLILHIPHPPEVLASSNVQHRRLLACIRAGDNPRAMQCMTEHVKGTEYILAGLLPAG